jgi:fucose permease
LIPEDFWHVGWPFFIIVPGVALMILALGSNTSAERLIVPGTVATVVGLLLFYQNLTNHWESWAYAWALIFPTAVGLGLLIQGSFRGRPTQVRVGLRFTVTGLALFLVGAFFFEAIIGISGNRFGRLSGTVLAAGLVALGLILLLVNFAGARRPNSR